MYNKITLKPEGFQVQQRGKQMWSFQYAHKNTQIWREKKSKAVGGIGNDAQHREKKKEEDRNELQEEVVVMEKGIDQEREREIDKGTIIDGFTWDFTHTP